MEEIRLLDQPVMLRDGKTTTFDRRLDRLVEFDARSREYSVRQFLRGDEKPVSKTWTIPSGVVLDQGKEGACAGFGTVHELLAEPEAIPGLDATFAREQIYWNAQRNDAWEGGSYPGGQPFYEGSSVLAAVKEAANLGYYGEYRWAFGEQDLALTVGTVGPAILGLNWYKGMLKPNARGYIRPTGGVVGGHCILCIGIDVTGSYYVLLNSWGPSWGEAGTCKVSRSDMARLLADNGEACVITQRFTPKAA